MEKQVAKHKKLLACAIIASFVSSAALLLCIIAVKTDLPIFLVLIPGIFWLGLVFEQLFMWKANAIFKKMKTNRTNQDKARPGIISFAKTPLGAMADLAFAVSFVVFLILAIGKWGNDSFQFVFLFIIVLSFRIHCIANGKNYCYNKKDYFYRRGRSICTEKQK